MNADFMSILRCVIQAPSGHNTQPWKFRITEEGIAILPDFKRALSVGDGDHRELFISLGCAVENLFIAAAHWGYETYLLECSDTGILMRLKPGTGKKEDNLFRQIEKRQTNHRVYKHCKISGSTLQSLQEIATASPVKLYFAEIGSPLADQLTAWVMQGNVIQMNDADFKKELLSWMRFNARHVRLHGDGLSYKVFGNPALPQAIAKAIVRCFLKPGKQNKADKLRINSSSHLVLFTTRQNTLEEWVELGRSLQRFLLKATGLGVACAFVNQPCEVEGLAAEMRSSLPIHQEYPGLLLRIGYAETMPYSPRRKLETVLI